MSIKFLSILDKITPGCFKHSVDKVLIPDQNAQNETAAGSYSNSDSTDNHMLPSGDSNNQHLLNSQELLSIFRKAECCTLDGLNEYDDDFRNFTPLGNLVTQEMKQAEKRLAKQVYSQPDKTNSMQPSEHKAHGQNNEHQQ